MAQLLQQTAAEQAEVNDPHKQIPILTTTTTTSISITFYPTNDTEPRAANYTFDNTYTDVDISNNNVDYSYPPPLAIIFCYHYINGIRHYTIKSNNAQAAL